MTIRSLLESTIKRGLVDETGAKKLLEEMVVEVGELGRSGSQAGSSSTQGNGGRTQIDRALAVGFKLGGTILCIPCALPLPWYARLSYQQFLHRIFYKNLTDELPWWFRKYMEIIVVGQNLRYGLGKTCDEYFERALFQCTDGPQHTSPVVCSEDVGTYVRRRFPLIELGTENACVQFTGGKDSTLAAIVASVLHPGSIDLLVFQHGLIQGVERAERNVGLLTSIFGGRYRLVVTDIEDSVREIYLRDYWTDLKKYGFEIGGFFCGSCRTAMHMATVLHCLENQMTAVYDGSNVSGFDISQRPWYIEEMKRFYSEFGIIYVTPTFNIRRCDKVLMEILGDQIRGSQPECMGGGESHNILWRCHSLDRYGKDRHERILREWVGERLQICKEHIMYRYQIWKNVSGEL